MVTFEISDGLITVDVRHLQIADHGVDTGSILMLSHDVNALGSIFRFNHVIPGIGQYQPHGLPHIHLVVDD